MRSIPLMPPFFIHVRFGNKQGRYKVQQTNTTIAYHEYKVMGKNGFLLLQNNEPILKRSPALKSWDRKWKLVQGQLTHASYIEKITQVLDFYLDHGK